MIIDSKDGGRWSTVCRMVRGDVGEEVTLEMKPKVSGSESWGQAGKNNSARGRVDTKARRGGGAGCP